MHDLLNQLKGARLSAFIALALNESEICLGLAEPLSIRAIAAQAHLSPRTVLRAVQDLVEQDLVTVSKRKGCREKLYQVSEHVRSGRAGATIVASRRKAQVKSATQTCVSGSRTKKSRVSSKKSKIHSDTLSESTRAPVAVTHRGPQAKDDHSSRSATANSRVANTKSKIDADDLAGSILESRRGSQAKHDHLSRSATANLQIPSAKAKIDPDHLSGSTAAARVPSAHRRSTTRRDNLSGSTTAISRISSTKSPIAPANASHSSRAHTRTRTRAHTRPRARVVVVSNTTSSLLKQDPKLLLLQQQPPAHFEACRAVFAAVPVYGNPLAQLARTVEVELAQAWVERLEDAPKSFTDPVGFMVKHLMHDPTEAPPPAWAKKKATGLFDADFVKYVHGRPEHAQYCREHPEEVDCICGKDWCEETGQWV